MVGDGRKVGDEQGLAAGTSGHTNGNGIFVTLPENVDVHVEGRHGEGDLLVGRQGGEFVDHIAVVGTLHDVEGVEGAASEGADGDGHVLAGEEFLVADVADLQLVVDVDAVGPVLDIVEFEEQAGERGAQRVGVLH